MFSRHAAHHSRVIVEEPPRKLARPVWEGQQVHRWLEYVTGPWCLAPKSRTDARSAWMPRKKCWSLFSALRCLLISKRSTGECPNIPNESLLSYLESRVSSCWRTEARNATALGTRCVEQAPLCELSTQDYRLATGRRQKLNLLVTHRSFWSGLLPTACSQAASRPRRG